MLDKYITQAQLKKQPYNLSDVNTTYLEYLQDMTKEFIDKVCGQAFEVEGVAPAYVEKRVDGTGRDTVFLDKRLITLYKVRVYSNSTNYQEYDASEFNAEKKFISWNIFSDFQDSLRFRVENFPEGKYNIGVLGIWGWTTTPKAIEYLQGRMIQKIVEDDTFAERFNSLSAGDYSETLAIRGDNEFYITGDRELDLIIRKYRDAVFMMKAV